MNDDDVVTKARRERKRRGWTQRDLADRTGVVSLGTVSNFERRVGKPQPEHLRAILSALGLEEAEDEVAAGARESWPADVQVFLDVMGVFLSSFSPELRGHLIREVTRLVVTPRLSGVNMTEGP